MFKNKRHKWYYQIDRDAAPSLIYRINTTAIPNTSAVTFRRLVWGTDVFGDPEPVLRDPFTVTVNGEVVFELKTKKWIARITKYLLTKK